MKKLQLVIIITLFLSGIIFGAIPASERAALIALYNSTNGDSWTDNTGWKTAPLHTDGFAMPGTEGSWYGVNELNDTVEGLSLIENGLTGNIPSNIGNFLSLYTLYLQENQITGQIPKELGNLVNLIHLHLYDNQLTGTIPKELANMSSLQRIMLAGNQLTGSIPIEFGNLSKLKEIQFQNNQISGNIPTSIGNLSKLEILYLDYNQFIGNIPNVLGNLNLLRILKISGNDLSGSIPTELGNLTNLYQLHLRRNKLTGIIPNELGNLSIISELDLSENELSGNIPASIGNLSSLEFLILYDNKLSGDIPASIGNLSNLAWLYLCDNQLSGSIPSELGNLTNLTRLLLNSNQLIGSIPPELGNLTNLEYFYLYMNQLTGNIPTELGNLTNLIELNLWNNQLSGSIPNELGNLTNLTRLDLDENQLNGGIPTTFGNLTNLTHLYLSYNKLTGAIPLNFSNLTNLSTTYTGIGYNALYTNNSTLKTFLDDKDSDWADTQTIAPEGVSAIAAGTTVNLSWTPITYTADTGGYRAYYSTNSGGPYTYFGQTANKSISTISVTGLAGDTTYYLTIKTRTNTHGNQQNIVDSGYSTEIMVTTTASIGIPILTTITQSGMTSSTAMSGGNITSDGGNSVTARGVCWSNSPNPTIASSKTSDGSGTGSFSSSITGLIANTTYYVRAYATNSTGTGYGNQISFTTSNSGPPIISINKTNLNFASDGSNNTQSQYITISNSGGGSLNWLIIDDAAWLSCSPESGIGTATITVSIDPTGLPSGTYSGSISVSDVNATNSPQTVLVSLIVKKSEDASAPFGSFDSPTDGATVSSSIPVTGWALDDIGVESIKIYRDPVAGEPTQSIYIGDAIFVEGARPDIEAAYPDYPFNYRAGWGYMLLTNFLPNGGNGIFVLRAIATDVEGKQIELGTKTIICDNANAVKPFGAIDTPVPGSTVSGNNYRNQGWVLTPMPNNIPTDGSTIKVYIDGAFIGSPTYNVYRSDIAFYFPGYANSDGALAYFDFDTSTYTNGVHTIQWSAVDSAGNTDGIGSRYFTITNTSSDKRVATASSNKTIKIDDLLDYEISNELLEVNKGFSTLIHISQDSQIKIKELERITLNLNVNNIKINFTGYLKVGDKLRKLPIGSTLKNGNFYWCPGPGFIGEYDLVFIDYENRIRKDVKILISLKFGGIEKE